MVVAASLLASDAPAAPTSRSDRQLILALLDKRAKALRIGDLQTFVSTMDLYDPAFRTRQIAFFRRVQRLPLKSYRLVANWSRFGDLARPSDRARYPGAEDVAIPVTEERYQLAGFDTAEAVEDLYLSFVKRNGRWLIAGDNSLDDLAIYSGRHLWDFGPVEQQRRGRFLQLSHPAAARSHDFLGLAGRALDRVTEFWTAPWHRRMVLLIPTTPTELKRLIQATFEVDDFVAFAYSSVDVSRGIDYTGHRIYLNPGRFAGRSDDAVVAILAHEMLHVASRYVSGPFVPIFVEEGIADFVGNAGDPSALSFFESEVAAGSFDGRLPEDFEFTVGSGTDIYRSYQESQSAIRFFVERWGLDAFVRFYKQLGSRKVVSGTANFHLSRALKKVTGLDLDGFEREWADSIN